MTAQSTYCHQAERDDIRKFEQGLLDQICGLLPMNHTILGISLIICFFTFSGCRTCCIPVSRLPGGFASNEVYQEFSNAGTTTAWRVRYAHDIGKGLYITSASFRRDPNEPWIKVLYDARLSDIFVPYEGGSPRYYDLSGFGFDLVSVNDRDKGCCGTLLDEFVVKEVRDRGVLWKNDELVYRGRELVLWATLDAANYNYIIQYGFQDDGTITFRLGATAVNLSSRPEESHMHNGLWRVDLDLNGFTNDTALMSWHKEPATNPSDAEDLLIPFNNGVEGGAKWVATEFSEIRVLDEAEENENGRNISYDLKPMRRGTARHEEDFTDNDFYVTRYRAGEMAYPQIDSYINGESITNTDVVLWYISSAHHEPRDEDGTYINGYWRGSALIMWSGFDLRPRDLFSRTPFYSY